MLQHLKVFMVVLVWMLVFAFYHHQKSIRSDQAKRQIKPGTSSVMSKEGVTKTTTSTTVGNIANQPPTTTTTTTTTTSTVPTAMESKPPLQQQQSLPAFPPIGQLLGHQTSRHAYVTLIHGIDNTFSYRGYLYNCLIMRSVLQRLGSTADFIALVGFTSDGDYYDYLQFESDFALLSQLGIRMYILPRLKPEKKKVSFGEMALLKTTPWNFTNYDRIQYLDGDVLPTQNLDCYFQLDQNAFNTGNASPLNSGWYMAIPSISLYNKMRQLAILRLSTPWDEEKGWGTVIPKGQVTFRNNGKAVAKWDFNGASLDQGLLFHTLCLNDGSVIMLDHMNAIKYQPHYQKETLELKQVLKACKGQSPMQRFAHFTGRNKPWLQSLDTTKDKNLLLWKKELDALQVGAINSSNYKMLGTKITLGLFHPNK